MGAPAVFLLIASACRPAEPRATVIGEAYAGPSTLTIHKEISVQSPPVATVKHGDPLEILSHHRTMYRVRTAQGAEGWVEERQLLAPSDMQNLKRLAQVAAKIPPQGAAVPRYGDMRVFMLPSRESSSFITVKDKEKVDVLGHVIAQRTRVARTPLLPPPPPKVLPRKKKSSGIPPVPMPKPPPLPPNWQELSKTEAPDEPPASEAAPTPTDDWSLVRTANGEAGWTLTRWLDMAIPDEVAQYAEGRRIVSYFPLGSIRDGDDTKGIWLWTTIGSGMHPYDFDNFRVFIWSLRHHRYETSYIERNITGYSPVALETVSIGSDQYPGFSVCMQKKDGSVVRRAFALMTNVVRYAGERPCQRSTELQDLASTSFAKPSTAAGATGATGPAQPSALERVKRKVRSWFGK